MKLQILVVGLLLVGSLPAPAQTLADAAAADATRRAAAPRTPKKVYSNKDLPTSTTPAGGLIATTITTKCAADWPTDFRMRAYCETQQGEAVVKLAERSEAMHTPNGQIIRQKCLGEWSDDFRMANYCEEQQIKALASLAR